MKLTKEKITEEFCKNIFDTTPADINAEANYGTPFQMYEGTIEEMGEWIFNTIQKYVNQDNK